MTLSLDQLKLNESQRQAVDWGEGPILVLAGPGTGKTLVLTLRAANLVKNSPNEYFRILGLTFTVKAANEMKDRVEKYLGQESRRVQIRTIHSFCADILRQHGSHLGLRPDFSIINDDKDRLGILNDAIREASKKGYDVDDPEDYLAAIDAMFRNGYTPETLQRHSNNINKEKYEKLAAVFSAYLDQLVSNNQLDFGSLLHYTRELLEGKSRIARQVRLVYKYICVDEFQDTNIAQYKIIRLLAESPGANLFVVADDDQTIFQWNGADPQRLEEMKNDYNPVIIQLPENYRCPKPIIDLATRLISHNNLRIGGKAHLATRKDHQPNNCIFLEAYRDYTAEINGLAEHLKAIPLYKREENLVLARNNRLLKNAKEILENQGIKAEVIKKKQDFETPPMRLFYGLLKLANSPNSRSQLNKLCSALNDFSGSNLSAEDISSKAVLENKTLFLSFLERLLSSSISELEKLAKTSLENLYKQLNFKKFITEALSIFSNQEIDIFPYFEEEKLIWEEDYNRACREFNNSLTLPILLQEIDLAPKSIPLGKDCVRLQTVHTAKGMEYKHVFLIGLVEDYFPAFQAIKQGENGKLMEEERRNCFVAITRASETLHMSCAHEYFGWRKEPSRFLKEMGMKN